MKYPKPHLTFAQQVEHLVNRGMVCSDSEAAEAVLQRLGYYRFSAYAYPFRELLAPDIPRETSVQFRSDFFISGTSFDTVAQLASFDRHLRMLCLDALEAIELALRVQIAYTLGAHSTFGHVDLESLDREACDRPSSESGVTVYEHWIARYHQLQNDARAEDFVTHYVEKYDGQLPIWVAIEALDFGSLVRLFGFLRRADQNAIALALGIRDGRLFARMLKSLNYIRNVSAHHARLWNRNLTYQLPKFPKTLIEPLGHLVDIEASSRKKIYGSLAVISHVVKRVNPELNWTARLAAHMRTFPNHLQVGLQKDMGFPAEWQSLEIWSS